MESCWGKENMKLYTVSMKRAIAKCHQEDAPELSLPPFRSSYRFVNTMINQGNDMEMLKNMMLAMSMSMNQDNSEYSYVQPYSTNSGRPDNFMDKMRMMMRRMKMKDMMRSNYQNDYDDERVLQRQDGQLQDEQRHVPVQADVQLLPVEEASFQAPRTSTSSKAVRGQPRPWRQTC